MTRTADEEIAPVDVDVDVSLMASSWCGDAGC